MRVTVLGHAGLLLETAGGRILCDPWTSPAYFGSWYPFPDNADLDWDSIGDVDYLYISHLHRDHFDPDLLRRHVRTAATVLLPDYPTDELADALRELGWRSQLLLPHARPVDLGGVSVLLLALTAPSDGPLGDSALTVWDRSGRVFNQNDARPDDLSPVTGLGAVDLHFLQFSGAIWWPWVYRLPVAAKRSFGARKRHAGMDRALHYVAAVGARAVVPSAGPPCFLDPSQFALNDLHDTPWNTFPDARTFLAHLAANGHPEGVLALPGSVFEVSDGRHTVHHPVADPAQAEAYTAKGTYLIRYAGRRQADIRAQARLRGEVLPAESLDLLTALRSWFTPLLSLADRVCAGVGGAVLLHLVDELPAWTGPEPAPAEPTSSGESLAERTPQESGECLVVDFLAREVRAWAGETARYEFWFPRSLVARLVEAGETDWVNSLLLGMWFGASRVGPYNEFVYTFFKCLSAERISHVEAWYAAQEGADEEIELEGWRVQRRCPHRGADLTRFGSVQDGVLTCALHHWRFDLSSGRCLSATGHPISARPGAAEDPAGAGRGRLA